ncbi:hypothetical protein LARI1_G004822 [Lachnellula arida]|uniref:Fungal N-terminal domain-containing protein n=1 Tax=Lachnellula arida TaxID=1316785 RepID=A0A8T9BCQ2_9HELO|nr:hypothetical protein LARI1_G004822 [Lachnellula arida]
MSGLEVLGAVASVAQLAGVVYAISKQLYEVADALSTAPSDIKDLAHDLEIFHEELVLHAQLVTDENARYSNQIIQLTTKIIGRCAEICIKIDQILKRLRSGSIWAKIKWIYKEKEIVKLLTRLRDLKLSLMRVLSLLTSAKADHMMNALGLTKPSVFEGAEDAGMSEETIADIEETRQKLAGISIGQSSPRTKVSVHSELLHVQHGSGPTSTPDVPLPSRKSTTVNLPKPSPSSLGWTLFEDRLKQYRFVVIEGEEPYFKLLPKAAVTKSTPVRVYLDKPHDAVDGTFPCMYPGGCSGNHSFFVPSDLERHYRIVHSGHGESQVGLSQTTGQLATADEHESLPHINHQATSWNISPQNVGHRSDPSTNLILKSSFGVADRSDDSTSAITAPMPIKLMQHALGSVQSFHSAVTHQALNTKPGEQRSGQEVMPIGTTSIHAENTSRKEIPQGTTNEIWKQEMIQSAIKHFGMTREHAESWVLTLPVPVPNPGTVPNKAQGGPYSWPDYDQYIAEGNASLPSTPTGSQRHLPSDLISGKVIEIERNERLPPSSRMNEYFIPKNGINRTVITADICRLLGNDALVRPGTYEYPETRQVHEGYYITAWRPPTAAMREDLKADSTRYEQKLRATASQGQSRNVALATSVSMARREYHGPTESSVGYPGCGAYTHPTSAYLVPPELGTHYSQNYDSPYQDVSYVSGANLMVPSLRLASRAPSSQPPSGLYYGRMNPEHNVHSSYGNDRTFISSNPRAFHLWRHAFHRLQEQSPDVTYNLSGRWRAAGAWTSPNRDLLLVNSAVAHQQADNLLSLLALSEDRPSADIEDQSMLSAKALESVLAISSIIKVMKSTLEFKVGSFVWTLFCSVLGEIVTCDQERSTTRSDRILPHAATIATLIARYNIMENIYTEWPDMSLDPILQESLIKMCTLVLRYLDQLNIYHESLELAAGEEVALEGLNEYVVEIQRADDICRRYTVRAFDPGFTHMVDSVEDMSEEEEEYGTPALKHRTKRRISDAGNDRLGTKRPYIY